MSLPVLPLHTIVQVRLVAYFLPAVFSELLCEQGDLVSPIFKWLQLVTRPIKSKTSSKKKKKEREDDDCSNLFSFGSNSVFLAQREAVISAEHSHVCMFVFFFWIMLRTTCGRLLPQTIRARRLQTNRRYRPRAKAATMTHTFSRW